MNIRTRLILTVVATTIIAALPTAYAVQQLAGLRAIALDLRARQHASRIALGRVQAGITEFESYLRSYVVDPETTTAARARQILERSRTELARLGAAGYDKVAVRATAQIDEIARGLAAIETQVEAGQLQEATDLLQTMRPLLQNLLSTIDLIDTRIAEQADLDVLRAQEVSASARETALTALLVALLVAIGVGSWSIHRLIRPVRRLRGAMATVAGGTLVAPGDLPYNRDDELGDLSRSFRAMAQQLAELDRMKAEFIGMASHDLKTPINVIGGYAELMEEGVLGDTTERQRKALDAIREQTRTLLRLVNQILDISRIEAGGLRIEPVEADPRALLEKLRSGFDALAQQKGIEFSVEADASVPRSVALDPDRIHSEVLGNLLSNAFKFTPPGGRIEVQARAEDGRLEIEVRDTGVGIPPDRLPHIFDKYYQVGSEARAAGAGLGLAIVREIVEAHDGSVHAESEPGAGSTFRILLPIRHLPTTDGGALERAPRSLSER